SPDRAMSKPHCGNPRAQHRMRDVRQRVERADRLADRRAHDGTSRVAPMSSDIRTAAGREVLDLLHHLHPGGHYSERVAAIEREAVAAAAALSGEQLRAIRAALLAELHSDRIRPADPILHAFDRALVAAATGGAS